MLPYTTPASILCDVSDTMLLYDMNSKFGVSTWWMTMVETVNKMTPGGSGATILPSSKKPV